MKKKIGVLTLVILLLVSVCGVTASAEADTLVITAGDVTGQAGQTVVITLNVVENPGFSGLMFYPAFPGNASWDFTAKKAGSDLCLDLDSGRQIVLTADEDCTCTGKLMDVHVQIPEDLPAGKYTISFRVYNGQCFNENFDRVSVSMPSVTLTVSCAHKNTVQVPEQAPTETDDGYTAGVFCNDCQTYISGHERIPALGHTHSYEAVVTPPTCGAEGYTTYTCVKCGDSYIADSVPATGAHTYGEWTVTKEATCGEAGQKTRSCAVCGHTQTEEIPAQEHTYGEWTVTKEATCGEAGQKTRSCAVCGYTQTEEIPAEEHTYGEWTVIKEATCAEAGKKTRSCAVCGHTQTEEIPAEEHTYGEWTVTKEATCAEAGKKTCSCEVCGYVQTEEIPAVAHTVETTPGKDATCTEAGLTEGKKCSVCGEMLAEQEEIAATGHTEEIIAGKDATCTEAGLTEGKICSVCGVTLAEQEEIAATGHTETVAAAKDPTCTETGLTEGKVCAVCGEALVAQEEIAATGHTEEIIAGKDATCTEAGLTEGTVCSVCDEVLTAQEEIPALGHNVQIIPGKPATILEDGLTDGQQCAACGETLVAQTVIPALGAPVSGGSTIEVKSETEGEVALPGGSLDEIVEAETEVKVDLGTVEVTISKDALAAIAGAAGDADISLEVKFVETNTLNAEQQQTLKKEEVLLVLDANMLAGGNAITEFGNGTIEVRIPLNLSADENGKDYELWYIDDAGNKEKIDSRFEDGHLVANLNHFSVYVVMKAPSSNNTALIIGIAAFAVIAAGAVVFFLLKKKRA